MSFDVGINFRATSGYVTDGTNETYCIGDTYPTTRGGATFGWDSAPNGTRDRLNTNDRRLAGINFDPTLNRNFRLDLPSAVSTDVHCAAGDAGATNDVNWDFLDNSTVFQSLSGSATGNTFNDATNTNYSNANWPGSETKKTRVFGSTIFKLNCSLGGTNKVIAHLRFVQAGTTPVLLAPSQVSYFLPLAEVYQPQKALPAFSGTTCGIVQTQTLAESLSTAGLQGPAFPSSTTTGNMIVVCIALNSASETVSTVADTAGNTYVKDKSRADITKDIEVWRSANITGGASFKVTVTPTGTVPLTFAAFEAQGYGAAPLDKTNSNNGTSTTPTTGTTGALTQADELVVILMAATDSASQTITTPTGFISQGKESGNSFQEMDAATQIVAATTALNPQWTLTNSVAWLGLIVTYKCAGASPVASSALVSPSQRFDPLVIPEIRWPLLETRKDPFLPAKPPMRNPSQAFDPLPPVEIRWPLIETRKDPFLLAKPPMAMPSQRWDPPVYILVQQPGQPFATPVVIPPSPKLKAPDQRWDLPLWPCVVQPNIAFAVPGVTVPVVAIQTVNGVFLIRLKGLPPNTLAYLRRNAPDRDICAYHPGYTVPAVDTALPLGASANVALAYLNNLDTINDVVVKDKAGGTVLATIKPLRSMFVRLDALNLIGTPLAVSGVGSPVLEYCLWSPA